MNKWPVALTDSPVSPPSIWPPSLRSSPSGRILRSVLAPDGRVAVSGNGRDEPVLTSLAGRIYWPTMNRGAQLARAQQAFETGQKNLLFRGQLIEDIPKNLRQ
jgi:hypothetical protein